VLHTLGVREPLRASWAKLATVPPAARIAFVVATILTVVSLANVVYHRRTSVVGLRRHRPQHGPVCTENLIRVDDAMESPKLAG
jgi:hypothetical protein